MPDKNRPQEDASAKPPEATQQPEPAVRALGPVDPRPLYRVVEVVRNTSGRLEEEGRVWHNDLARVRRFGRAVAANSSGQKVLVVDGVGNLLEELSVVPQEGRSGAWQGWQKTELPPLPPRQLRRPPKPAKLAAPPVPKPNPNPPAPAVAPAEARCDVPVAAEADAGPDTQPAVLADPQ
jgi:hypothetical protein